MLSGLRKWVRNAYAYHRALEIGRWLDDLRASPRAQEPLRLTRFGRKGFSQSDEDGMILEIFERIGQGERTFVEFGVEEGVECNTALLLMAGWRGLWMDGSPRHVAEIQRRHALRVSRGQLAVVETMVTAENIDRLLADWSGGSPASPAEIDLLSIDVDGNDYWIWRAVKSVSARVVVMEYNAAYPPPVRFVRAYDAQAQWDGSNYYGASLSAFETLAGELGYALVGCSLSGVNAFFVRRDQLLGADGAARFHQPYTAREHYEPARFPLTLLTTSHRPRFGENAAP